MKKILIALLLNTICYSQNATITYNFTLLKNENLVKQEYLEDIQLQAIKGAEKLNFILQANDSISKFSIAPIMETDQNKEVNYAIMFSRVKKPIYTYKGNIYRNNSSGVFNEDSYLIVEPINSNWTLTNETKEIDGYLCYKATSEYIVFNSKGEFRHPVIAWYCPQISIPLGPLGYGKLPGLILELQEWNNVFGLEKIQFLDVQEPIFIPTKGIKISNQDYQNKVGEAFQKSFQD